MNRECLKLYLELVSEQMDKATREMLYAKLLVEKIVREFPTVSHDSFRDAMIRGGLKREAIELATGFWMRAKGAKPSPRAASAAESDEAR